MRRLLLILAFIAAAISGWTPVMAASLHVATMASRHAHHDMAGDPAAHSDHADHEGRDDQGGKTHGGVHPLLCSACFAVVSEIESVRPALLHEGRGVASGSPLIGGEIMPPVPPPRTFPL